MKSKGIKTLVVSLIAIVICFTMLLGTTFAWFTDSVSSSNNIIASGLLDVNAYWMEGSEDPSDDSNWIEFNGEPIFNNSNWEPGRVEAKHIKIANEGTLAFKYKVVIAPNGAVSTLADVIDVYFLSQAQTITRDSITSATKVGTLKDLIEDEDGAMSGILLPVGTTPNNPETEEIGSVAVSLAFKMQENAGNEYYGLSIGTSFDIQIIASQYEYEEDTFGSDYDANAEYPEVDTAYVSASTTEDTILSTENVSVTVPAGAQAGAYRLEVANQKEETNAETEETALSVNISLFNGNDKATGEDYPVSINVGVLKNVTKLSHNGNEITNYEYSPLTGILEFTTQTFSPFVIESTDLAEGGEVEEGEKIVAGTFKEYNPADLDSSLAEQDSEYIAINYEMGGKTYFVVAERATTTVISADAVVPASFEQVNNNYAINPSSSGKLYSIISGLQNNEHSTVYLLPGIYNEGTTINVYSSMDIIGLGDKKDIKVVKQSSSSSNRHLFNVSGTKADYIQVTISNMTLDATARTTNNKDNAAVQSIRKSKVKCYNLDIIKGTASEGAFYVNGNNAVDGVKYTAYLYAENCTLDATRTFAIVSTTGTYKFYHTNLTYNAGESVYTNNSGSIKNVQMEADDWDWEN